MSVPLTLLGLLEREPSHGYDLKRDYDAYFGRGKPLPFGQVYATLARLARDGKAVAGAAEPGDGPDRKRYAITPAGTAEFHRLLREAWGTPGLHFPVALYAAANFLDALPRAEVLSAIERHIDALGADLEIWNAGESAKLANLPPQLREYVRLSFANGREHIEADIRLLRALRELVPTIPRLDVRLPTFEDTAVENTSEMEGTS